jgi:hypothetical protein
MDVVLAALIPPRRRASFLLGGAVSVSMLRGDLENECLLEDVVDDGLDDDEPFFTTRFSPYCNKSLRKHHYFGCNRGYYCTETVIWLQFVCLL